jgi:hypothetical protein
MRKLSILLAFTIVSLSVVVWAKSSYKSAFNTLYGTTGGNLDACWTCHVEGQPYSVFNPYGDDVKTEFNRLGDITAALQAVEDTDSDGDGDTNIIEITAGTLPGNALNSTPAEKTTWGALKKRYE